jgi:hypothetical protein
VAVGPLIAGVLLVLFGTGTLAVAQEVQLANGYALKIIDRINVAVSSGSRDYHGPCICRAPNGDLLLCHKDAYTHGGGDGYVHQWRSTDEGFTWTDEGVAAKWTDQGLDSLYGEYTVAPDGNRMAMLVQRRTIYGGNPGIISSVWYTSENNGSTWNLHGEMDPIEPEGVLYASSPFSHDGTAYVGAWSTLGHALYVSTDNAESWERRSVIFQHDTHPDFADLPDRGPPYYPRVMRLSDGRLMAICYITPPVNRCYTRFSDDDGLTWGPIEKRLDLPLWAPRMNCISDEVLIVTGRDVTRSRTAALFSVDYGETWDNMLDIDGPTSSSYGYSDSIQISEDRFWVFTSSRGNIVGVLLEVTAPIPEPSTMMLLVPLGLIGLVALGRRRQWRK